MSCAELFGLDNGRQWLVAHYLFSNSRSDTKKNTLR
jgi:hypothetical protein